MFALLVLISCLLIFYDIKICKKFNNDYLSRDSSLSIRGAAAIFIVLHHLSQQIPVYNIFNVFKYIGFILVAIFFFLSGYGLKVALNNKKNYLEGFLFKHLSSIIIPFWMLGCIQIVLKLVKDKSIKISEIFGFLFGFHKMWFVVAIMLFYVMFWFAYKSFDKHPFAVLCIELTLYVIICLFLKLHSSWTASTVAFLIGIIWAEKKNEIDKVIQRKWLIYSLVIGGLFLVTFTGRLLLVKVNFWNNDVFQCMMRNLVSASFVLFCLIIVEKVQFQFKIMNKLGKQSLTIYMAHYVFLSYANKNLGLFIIMTISIVIFVDGCSNSILKKMKYMKQG